MDKDDKNDTFFQHIFPSVKGHGKIFDEYLSNPNAENHSTVMVEKIKFHDKAADNQDWRVKQCYTLLIAAANKIENGADNLWKQAKSGGRQQYTDFGRYVAYAWPDKKY